MELGKSREQQHSPCKPPPKVLASASGIAHLNEKTESEKQREGGISISGEKEKDYVPYIFVSGKQPLWFPLRDAEEVIMFKIMEKHYGEESEAAERVYHLEALWLDHRIGCHNYGNDWR